jgi:hypothetical protein
LTQRIALPRTDILMVHRTIGQDLPTSRRVLDRSQRLKQSWHL